AAGFVELVASSAPSPGHCNTMGTASTMNGIAEALGMSLPGSAAIPAPHRDRARVAYETGRRIVEMVHEDLKPSDILTREAFENAIVVHAAIGGSTNALLHLPVIAREAGVDITIAEDGEVVVAGPQRSPYRPAPTAGELLEHQVRSRMQLGLNLGRGAGILDADERGLALRAAVP
ncbi:MAG: dihydroxy-acid dehydratase, partial [Gammaproteobacteria bacterium]